MSVNRVVLIGQLGADPEQRMMPNGSAVCNFRIATSEKYKDRSGNVTEKTEWHTIAVFGQQAENCFNNLKKGSKVYVQGKLTTESWEKDGQKHYRTKIIAAWVEFMGGNGQSQRSGGGQPRGAGAPQGVPQDDADIPF